MQSARYLNEDDAETIPALHAIRDNTKLDLIHEKETLDEHFPSIEELQTLNLSEDMITTNANEIEECQAEIAYHQSLLPQFVTPNGCKLRKIIFGRYLYIGYENGNLMIKLISIG